MPSQPCNICGILFSNDRDLNRHFQFIHNVSRPPPGVVVTPRPLGFGATIQMHNQVNPQAPLGSTFDLLVEDNACNYSRRRSFHSTITFPNIMASLAEMSAPIAGHYIPGRTTGFTPGDGQWWFVLIGRQPNRRRGPTSLRDTVFLATMRSELMTASQWAYASVWHVRWSHRFLIRYELTTWSVASGSKCRGSDAYQCAEPTGCGSGKQWTMIVPCEAYVVRSLEARYNSINVNHCL